METSSIAPASCDCKRGNDLQAELNTIIREEADCTAKSIAMITALTTDSPELKELTKRMHDLDKRKCATAELLNALKNYCPVNSCYSAVALNPSKKARLNDNSISIVDDEGFKSPARRSVNGKQNLISIAVNFEPGNRFNNLNSKMEEDEPEVSPLPSKPTPIMVRLNNNYRDILGNLEANLNKQFNAIFAGEYLKIFCDTDDEHRLVTTHFKITKIEFFRRRSGASQCFRCILFNHSANNCNLKEQCLKCGQESGRQRYSFLYFSCHTSFVLLAMSAIFIFCTTDILKLHTSTLNLMFLGRSPGNDLNGFFTALQIKANRSSN